MDWQRLYECVSPRSRRAKKRLHSMRSMDRRLRTDEVSDEEVIRAIKSIPTHCSGIAFDSAVDGGNANATNLTFSFDNAAGNLVVVGFAGDAVGGADDYTSVTYAGAGMTLVAKNTTSTGNRNAYMYYLLNPATGNNNVSISCTSGHYTLAGAVSYSGVQQSAQPDNYGTAAGIATTQSITEALTTIANNCWTVLLAAFYTGTNPSAGTGSTLRTYDGTYGTWGLFDSNGPITPAGSYSMSASWGGSSVQAVLGVMASWVPGGAAPVSQWPFFIGGNVGGGFVLGD